MNKKSAETTIRTSIRIRPCSDKEKDMYPGPSLVQAGQGEVRLYAKPALSTLNAGNNRTGGGARETGPGKRPGTPTNRPGTPNAAASEAAQAVWRAVAMQQLNDYQSYPFANVYGPDAGNEEVYNGSGCRDIVDSVLGGCNGTIFVYGQTGAGKTHTMDAFTHLVLQQLYTAAARDDSNCEISITVSAVELYNEVLRCLLSGRENLQLRMGAGPGPGAASGVVLEGADERPCTTHAEAAAIVESAKSSRSVGETRANARSSRSHLILRIKVEILQLSSSLGGVEPSNGAKPAGAASGPASVSFSLLNLVDLAGSERIDKSGSSDTPLRLREALNINKSLLCLGNVVTALAERSEGRRNTHIPYRDSKLTRLLEDSLGGNAATALLSCITPLPEWHLEQTRATLEFAARAARVVCSPQRNVLKLVPNPGSSDSSALIAQLQAEVETLKALLAQHQDGPSLAPADAVAAAGQQPKLQSAAWDSCSSSSSGMMAEAAVAAEVAAASESGSSGGSTSPRSRSKWAHRLRLSVGGSSARAAAGSQASSSADNITAASPTAAAPRGLLTHPSAPDLILPPGHHRSTAGHGSLLWKFFHARSSSMEKLPSVAESSSLTSPQLAGSTSLRSTGLLMLPGAAKNSSSSSGGGAGGRASSASNAAGCNTAPGMLSRWATFHSSHGGVSSMIMARASEGGLGRSTGSFGGGMCQVVTGSFRAGSSGGGSCAASMEAANNISTQVAAAEAAMALRDHIIKQLVTALQQKKAEVKALREQQAALQRQLEAAEGEGVASKQKLRELAEGIQALAAAREEEFERWKGHLEGVEVALQAAQQESLTYRQEALALVQQLTQLQARYRSLQSDTLRRSSLIQSANQSILLNTSASSQAQEMVQLHTAAAQQSTQLQSCLGTLMAIEECLRQVLAQTAAPLTHTGTTTLTVAAAAAASGNGGSSMDGSSSQQQGMQHNLATAASHLSQLSNSAAAKNGSVLPEISSHMIQTISTRFDMSSGLVSRAGSTVLLGGGLKGPMQLEDALEKIQGIIPLLRKAAASVTAAAGPIMSVTAAAAAARGMVFPVDEASAAAGGRPSAQLKRDVSAKEGSGLSTILSCGSSSDSEGGAGGKIAAGRLDAGGAADGAAADVAAKCHKCDSLKPLLALMQKLKDEVQQLRSIVKSRDTQLAAAASSSATMKRDLDESRQQVGSLQERIDELAEELEAARAAASAAAAAAAAAPAAASGAAAKSAAVDTQPAAGTAAAAAAGSGEIGSPGTQLSRQSSSSKVPLMGDDTPLAELHAQILMSWHALAMPRTYRAAFVLGHGSSPDTSPWADRAQCQAHVALLACLHQLQEDQPAAALTQRSILAEEAELLDAGLAAMSTTDFEKLAQQWSVTDGGSAAARRAALLQNMWAPCSAVAADALASASAAVCQQCLSCAPALGLAALTIRSNASLMAATSNALAEAAS